MHLDGSVLLPLGTLLVAVVVDWLAGIAVAVKAGTFTPSELPRQLENVVLPYATPTAMLAVVQGFLNGQHDASAPAFTVAVVAFAASYVPKFMADAKTKLEAFSAGVPVGPTA